jgi:pyrimidine operon attenuation protein/uracil phosphoribosyltransferase
VLGARRDGDLDGTIHGRDLDPVPQRGLDDVDAQLVDDALVTPRQVRVRLDAQHHVQVAGRPSADARLTLAAEADL